MGFDWFTFCAQIINFLILVWLLKKVLYKPVLDAMAAREAKIATRMREANEKADLAAQEKEKFHALQQQLQTSAAEKMRQAKEEADTFRDELFAGACREIEENRKQWLSSLAGEKESFLRETSLTIAKGFHKLATRTLRDLAGDELENRVLMVFLSELGKLSHKENEHMRRYLTKTGESVSVTSAFVLSSSLRDEIRERLEALWGENLSLHFIVNESLLAGIHIEVAGKKIQWDAGNYLEEFTRELTDNLERTTFSER